MPHAIAEPRADRGPPELEQSGSDSKTPNNRQFRGGNIGDLLRRARQPPVMNPEMIAFHASSFCRHPLIAQSKVENIPPQTPKLPPVTGARAFIDEIAPTKRSPYKDIDIVILLTGSEEAYPWRVSSSFNSVPDTTTYCAH